MGMLRLILALSVVLWHLPGHPMVIFNGGIAVMAFFIISGFYMSLVIDEKYSRTGSLHWRRTFYVARALRLFPAYALVCGLIQLAYSISGNNGPFGSNDLSSGTRLVVMLLNVFIVGQDLWQMLLTLADSQAASPVVTSLIAFFGRSALNPTYIYIGQAWSLSVELVFYLAAPFLVLSKRRVLLAFVILMGLRLYMVANADILPNAPWRSRFFLVNLPIFLLGTVSYWLYRIIKSYRHSTTIGRAIALVGGAAIIFQTLAHGGVLLFDGPENYDELRLWIFYVVLSASIPFVFCAFKRVRWDAYIGELSYPLYLIHGLVIGIVASRQWGGDPKSIAVIAVTVSLILSAIIYIFVDRPIDRIRAKVAEQPDVAPRVAAATGAGLGFVLTGAVSIAFLAPHTKHFPTPYLQKVVGHYNIVKFGSDYYAVPQGVRVNWRNDDLTTIEGMIKGGSVEQVENRLLER